MDKERIVLRSALDLEHRIADMPAGLVTFDGAPHAGKTWLAREMGRALGRPAIDFDCYLNRQQGTFIDALRITELMHAIDKARTDSPVVLLSGICMLRVLDMAKLHAALSIYVQRLSPMGIPNDLDTTDAEDGMRFDDDPGIPPLFKEIHLYHADYRPLANADIVYRRTAD
ncbi:TPA: hypothetical protein RZC51_006886 [Burkholderia cenocepacia]|nr:hypothetical protein [Burkholderia cenocepacia]